MLQIKSKYGVVRDKIGYRMFKKFVKKLIVESKKLLVGSG